MRIISLNVNGIRSAARKGFFSWMARQRADVICVQELKAQADQLTDPIFFPKKYYTNYFFAKKKGYSGVGIYSRVKPEKVISGFGVKEFDDEGRYIEAQFQNISVVSLYAPSGSSGDERQQAKFRFLDVFLKHLLKIKKKNIAYAICGDWNIAHKNIDLKNWRSNQKNSGFLPEERAWLDYLLYKAGYIDAFREVNTKEDQYTWWSNRGRAWEKNVGWRIDYQILSPKFSGTPKSTRIYKSKRFSDHAPLIIDYDFKK